VFLLPWYDYARAHGLGALRSAFTNYAPAYSYLLIAVARLDGLAAPLVLIKAVSWSFEFGCAVLAAGIVRTAGAGAISASLAFAGVWLAPTVLFNGAAWGQCDALWTFFLLLAVRLYLARKDGAPAFGTAFAVKAQGVFLGPFVLGLIFRRRVPVTSLAALPTAYLLAAVPVLVAGRPLGEVAKIYADQAAAFHLLTVNGASLWALLGPVVPYALGLPLGLLIAALGGLALAGLIARARLDEPRVLILAAAASVLATPFLLPMMHERYFFAFEVLAIILAAVDRRDLRLAVQAQASGVAAYLAYNGPPNPPSIAIAAAVNAVLLLTVVRRLYAAGDASAVRAPVAEALQPELLPSPE
jgi:Gpi18-like mannosyltransferase